MNRNSHGHDIVRVIAEIYMHHVHEAFDRDSRGRQQKQRQGDLAGDQHRVESLSAHAAGNFSCTGLHNLANFRACKLKRGKESKEYSGDQRESEAEQQHGYVDVEVSLVGERLFRQAGYDESQALVSEQHAQTPSYESEDERLGEKLADDADSAGPNCRAHSKFMLASGASRQQQNGD